MHQFAPLEDVVSCPSVAPVHLSSSMSTHLLHESYSLAKLAGLLIKTLSKPVAKQIKSQMVKYDSTRTSLIWIGQQTNAITTRMTIWSSGYTVRSITPLEEGEALSRGAEIMSESFIFLVGGSIVVWEYHRSSEKEKKKEELRLQKIRDDATKLHAKLVSLDERLTALEEYAKANRNSILGLGIGGKEYVEPQNVVKINDDDGMEPTRIEEHKKECIQHGNSEKDSAPTCTANENVAKQPSHWSWLWPFGK
jgi:hypothetical protein